MDNKTVGKSRWLTSFTMIVAVFAAVLFSGVSVAEAGVLEKGKKSFKLVLDDVYEEMGRPRMTEEIAEKMDRLIFLRDIHKKPAFSRKVNISWVAYKDSITALISGVERGRAVKVRVLWRPDKELKILDPDAVLKW